MVGQQDLPGGSFRGCPTGTLRADPGHAGEDYGSDLWMD